MKFSFELKLTENDDHSRLCDALVASVRAAVGAADGSDVLVRPRLFLRRVYVALPGRRGFRISREDDGDVVSCLATRGVDDRVAVVRPRNFVLRVTLARQVSVRAFGRHQKYVLRRFHDRAKPACFDNTVIGTVRIAQIRLDAVRKNAFNRSIY